MSLSNVRSAIAKAFTDSAIFGANDIQWENKKFTPPNKKWAAFWNFGGEPLAGTLGEGGVNKVESFVQVDLNYPQDSGEKEANADYETLESIFTVGARLSYSGQQVTITCCGRTNGRIKNNFWCVPVTIYFYAHINR